MKVFVVFLLSVLPICGYAIPFRDGYAKNASGQCVPLCGGGFTKLNTSLGISYPLFASKNTSPALGVQVGDNACYADLVLGNGSGINIAYNDNIYHTNAFVGCPKSFNLSYNCGDGATGTPPDTREIEWGKLFFVDSNTNTSACSKPGYVFGGWQSGSTNYTDDKYYQYLSESDTTLNAVWSSVPYGIAYTCGVCDAPYITGTSSQYLSARSGATVTVASSAPSGCGNPQDATLTGFKIQYADGTDTGKTVAAGGTFVYDYDENLRLSAMWRENPPKLYNLSYDCGDGATGTPPASRTVKHQKLFISGADIGTCNRPGYYVSGWKIGNTSYSYGGYGVYSYDGDKTITAQWSPVSSYGIAYTCGVCDAPYITGTSSQYLSARSGATVTVASSAPSGCGNPQDATLTGFKIQYADGTDTGKTVAAGGTFVYDYDENLRLSAMWRENPPKLYNLSYNCGDGATGTPPASRTVKHQKLFISGADIGTCNRPGYYVSGWKIGNTSYSYGGYGNYSYDSDEIITAQWSPVSSYGAAYVCNNGSSTSSYLSVKSGNQYTPSTTVCTAPADKTFAGYAIQFADGTDTGTRIGVGESFTFNFDENIRLSAIWE